MAFCNNCGNPISAGSNFCNYCGKPLSTEVTSVNNSSGTEQHAVMKDTVFYRGSGTLIIKNLRPEELQENQLVGLDLDQ